MAGALSCLDIWIKVAEYIPPNPVTYARLALISKDCYMAFTSDRIWKHINPYGAERDIFFHFLVLLTPEEQCRVYTHWQTYRFYDQQRPYDGELYSLLGILVGLRQTHNPPLVVHDRQLMWCAINLNENAIRFASSALKNDKEFAKVVISKRGCIIDQLGEDIKDNRELVLLAVKNGCPKNCTAHTKSGFPLKCASPRLLDDCEIIVQAVQKDGLLIKFASRSLRSSETIVELAIRQNPRAVLFSYLLGCRRLVYKAIKSRPAILELAIDFYDDDEVVMAAVSRCGRVLQYASKRLRNTEEIALKAVCNDPFAIKYCSSYLRQSAKVVKTAVVENGLVLSWTPFFWGDREMLEIAVNHTYHALRYANEFLTDDYDFMLRQIAKDGRAIQFCSPRLIKNKSIVYTAVKSNGKAFAYVNEPFNRSQSLVLRAIQTYPEAALWAHPEIKQKQSIIRALRKLGREDVIQDLQYPNSTDDSHEDWPLRRLESYSKEFF